MMEQLLLHLIGDYVTQSDWMAKNKTGSWFPAVVHSVVYGLPFLLIASPLAVAVIIGTHILIDHWRLARYVVFAKNWVTDTSLRWADCSVTGYHKDAPPWLAFWLLIIADNTIHLAINWAAVRWLS